MKKSILHTIIKEEVKKALNEAVDPKNWPIGFFEVKNTFQITPGGGWTVTFTQGQLLQVAVSKIDQSIQTITRYNALKGQWDVVAPPISGYKDDGGMFPIAAFGGSQSWTAKFAQNTTPMSKAAAEASAKKMAAETTLSAKEAIKMLSTMPGNQMVKITIIK